MNIRWVGSFKPLVNAPLLFFCLCLARVLRSEIVLTSEIVLDLFCFPFDLL